MPSHLEFCVLGSGSGGNCTVVRCSETGAEAPSDSGGGTDPGVESDPAPTSDISFTLLLDTGLSMLQTRRRMDEIGLTFDDVDAILLTHLDQDHFNRVWAGEVRRRSWHVHVHHRHAARALSSGLDGHALRLFDGAFDIAPGVRIAPLLLAHDALGTVGYRVEHAGVRLGFATDLGRVPESLIEHFDDLDALAFESNYDRSLQLASDRPPALKQRIMSGAGHLSNEQSLEAIRQVAAQSQLQHIVLLHLSRQCNAPGHIRSLWSATAPALLDHLTLAHQTNPTPLLRVHPRASRATTPPPAATLFG